MKTTIVLLVLLCLCAGVLGADADGDGLSDEVEKVLGAPPKTPQKWTRVVDDENKNYDDRAAKKNAPDILALDAVHVAGDRMLFRVTFASNVETASFGFVLYADMDNDKTTGRPDGGVHRGTEVMLGVRDGRVTVMSKRKDYNRTTARVALRGNVMLLSMDAPMTVADGKTTIGLHLLSQNDGGSGDGTEHVTVTLPVNAKAKKPALPLTPEQGRAGTSKAYYRWVDDKLGVKLESPSNRGLTRKDVTPDDPMKPGRPRPYVTYTTGPKVDRPGSIDRQTVKVNFKEETGLSRTAPVSFGFPLTRGALFDPAHLRLLDDKGTPRPTQVSVTAHWPDGSIKWVVVDAMVPLEPGREVDWTVEFGNQVPPAPAPTVPYKVSGLGADDRFVEVTARGFRLRFNKVNVAPPGRLWSNPGGAELTDRHVVMDGGPGMIVADASGKQYASSLATVESFRVEQRGPLKVVFRLEGRYGAKDHTSFMRYVARLTVWPSLHRVVLDWTHINDQLDHEFTELQSLSLPVTTVDNNTKGPRSIVQARYDRVLVDGQPTQETSMGGVTSGRLGVAVRHAAERWPKAFRTEGKTLSIDLLPRLPEGFENDLPHHLRFPFVQGNYRLKWGMAFTERIGFQADAQDELTGHLDTPVVAVLPPEYVHGTGAFDEFAPPRGTQFKMYDQFVSTSLVEHMKLKQQQQEFGFLNYGDWYGERGRNWGNNEYDLARGLFTQFVRTGERRYYRWAMAAARHQADVDMVHAYPDPYYVGANHQHSIGHTGEWSQRHQHARWSHAYDSHTAAMNGHTWASGMVDGWYLSGEPALMDACIGLGEHIAWGMSRRFERLGTHERTAGWSLAAIAAIYRATYDPVYLEAMKRIAEVPLREQDLADSGTWPHRLPLDHSGRIPDQVGNNVFLIGILLGGLKDYHELTDDPRAEKSIVAAADWLLRGWRPTDRGWPYSVSPDGRRGYGHTGTGLNPLVVAGLAYASKLTGDDRYIEVAEQAIRANWRQGPQPIGKRLAMQMHFAGETMVMLQDWYVRTLPDKGHDRLSDPDEGLGEELALTEDVKTLWLRGPDQKVLYLKLVKPEARVVFVRKPHGSVPKAMEFARVTVVDKQGKTVYSDKTSTDRKARLEASLKGKPGSVYTVRIVDGLRAVWALEGDGFHQVVDLGSMVHFGNLGKARMHLFVPEGTRSFKLTVHGVHTGGFGAAVFAGGKLPVAMVRGANTGKPALPNFPDAEPAVKTLEVTVPEGTDGRMWSVVTWAAGNLRMQLEGVPPYLAPTRDDWFDPQGD